MNWLERNRKILEDAKEDGFDFFSDKVHFLGSLWAFFLQSLRGILFSIFIKIGKLLPNDVRPWFLISICKKPKQPQMDHHSFNW